MLSEERTEELEALEQYRKGLASAPVVYRPDGYLLKVAEGPDRPLSFVASEESEDRLGDVIKVDGWELDAFKKNPVFLYVHDHAFPPIGRVPSVNIDGKQLLASVQFDREDEFAALIQRKYQSGFMRGVSVGFRAIEFEANSSSTGARGTVFKKQELVEISAVPVPAHPKALMRALGRRSFFWMPAFFDKPEPDPMPPPALTKQDNEGELQEALYLVRKLAEGDHDE